MIERNKLCFVELLTNTKGKMISTRFWDGAPLVGIELCFISHDIPVVRGQLNLISQFQSAVGTGPQNLSGGCCKSDVLKALDQDRDR